MVSEKRRKVLLRDPVEALVVPERIVCIESNGRNLLHLHP
jgi:hypothetical protein